MRLNQQAKRGQIFLILDNNESTAKIAVRSSLYFLLALM